MTQLAVLGLKNTHMALRALALQAVVASGRLQLVRATDWTAAPAPPPAKVAPLAPVRVNQSRYST